MGVSGAELVYSSTESTLSRWEPQSSLLNTVLLAALSTLLSYQAAAVLFDLFLGLKPRHTASPSTLQTLHLVRGSSPLAVTANLFRQPWLSRRRLHLAPTAGLHTRPHQSPAPRALPILRLLLLLAVAPAANIAAIFLTLERSADLSVAEAKLGGLALGLAPTDAPALNTTRLAPLCVLAPLQLTRSEDPLAEFSICDDFSVGLDLRFVNTTAVRLYVHANASVSLDVFLGGLYGRVTKVLFVRAEDNSFYVRVDMSPLQIREFAQHVMATLAPACDLPDATAARDETGNVAGTGPDVDTLAFYAMSCPSPPLDEANPVREITREVGELISLVNADELLVVEPERVVDANGQFIPNPVFRSADGFPLLRRRRRNLSLLGLLILTAVVVVLRGLSAALAHNDVDLGIEVIIKRRLGLRCCESLLCADQVVGYSEPQAGVAAGVITVRDREEIVRRWRWGRRRDQVEETSSRGGDV